MDSTPQGGINIGDAVISFLGDTQQLDQSIDGLNARVEAGMAKSSAATEQFGESLDSTGIAGAEAGEAVSEGMQKATYSVREAQGATMLLGEQFGVHLPRHVSRFIATLPGVGEAMSAAFSAVAVIFVLEAVVKLTEKVTDFITTTFIYTKAMKDLDAAIASSNKQHVDMVEKLKDMKTAFDDSLLTPAQRAKKAHEELTGAIKTEEAEIHKLQTTAATAATAIEGMWDKTVNFTLGIVDRIAGTHLLMNHLIQQQTEANKAAQEKQNSDILALEDKLASDKEKLREADITRNRAALKAKLDDQYEYWLDSKNLQDNLDKEMEKQSALLVKNLADIKKSLHLISEEPVVPQHLKDLEKQIEQIHRTITQITPAVNTLGQDFNQAFLSAATGAEGWGRAMEDAVGKSISALGQYCQVQAMAHLAKAIGEWWNGAASAADFAAAAEFEAAALACGAAGGLMSGAGGGGGGGSFASSHPGNGPVQTTGSSSQSPVTSTNVQHFAGGGLISAPTLAVLGDSPSGGSQSEAVLPLENESVMGKLADSIASRMGGGGGMGDLHVHVKGLISDDVLTKVMKKMSRKVSNGTGTLHASNTLRITKRSA